MSFKLYCSNSVQLFPTDFFRSFNQILKVLRSSCHSLHILSMLAFLMDISSVGWTGFLIQFFYLSSMFWLNSMCFDVWTTFRQLRCKKVSLFLTLEIKLSRFRQDYFRILKKKKKCSITQIS